MYLILNLDGEELEGEELEGGEGKLTHSQVHKEICRDHKDFLFSEPLPMRFCHVHKKFECVRFTQDSLLDKKKKKI